MYIPVWAAACHCRIHGGVNSGCNLYGGTEARKLELGSANQLCCKGPVVSPNRGRVRLRFSQNVPASFYAGAGGLGRDPRIKGVSLPRGAHRGKSSKPTESSDELDVSRERIPRSSA